jgi:diguanylate cyclase (GGDEF)-like protein/PAS domain S-box-containing protein
LVTKSGDRAGRDIKKWASPADIDGMEQLPEGGDPGLPMPFSARLHKSMVDPTMLVVPLIAALFCLFRWLRLIAVEPYWVYIALLTGAAVVRVIFSALWEEPRRPWHSNAYIACSMAVIAVVAYSTGWGPILSIGFLFGAATSLELFGSKATLPCLVWTTVAMVLAQLAIALGLAPTIIHQPTVFGVAGLSLVGALLIIGLLGQATTGGETLEAELRRSERRFSALVNSSSDIVVVVGADGVLEYASPAFQSVLGYAPEIAHTFTAEMLLHPEDRPALTVAMAAAGGSGSSINEEIRLRRADGQWLWFEAAITNLTADPDVNGFVADLRDITRRKDAEDRLAHAALHDALTGLPNRTLILNRVEQMLARARRQHTKVAALFLDLDNFKDINDTLGHKAGDELLAEVATRMAGALREGETVGRLGGDEFVVLVEGSSLAAGANVVAERMVEVLAPPFSIPASNVPLEVTASIGIAEGDRAITGELLRDADIALYQAKAAGKHCAVAFSPSMQEAVDHRRGVELDLHHALEDGQFFLVYQPTYDLVTGTINGVEALLRWRHPERGVVQPGDFIPVLESTRLIVAVGDWVLLEACRQGAAWHRQGHRVSMSVNISGVQLERDRIIDDVHCALSTSGFDPDMLILELTETTLMHDVEAALVRLNWLKSLGVRLAIDDFGTGYSSLAYLQQFPIDVLKIDRSFISGVTDSEESAAIVHTLVQLGKVLGLETVAEGIETDDQRRWLQAESITAGQGYLFARPVDVEGMDQLLEESAGRLEGAQVVS